MLSFHLAVILVELHVKADTAVNVLAVALLRVVIALVDVTLVELETSLEVLELGHVGAGAVLGPLVLPESGIVAVAGDLREKREEEHGVMVMVRVNIMSTCDAINIYTSRSNQANRHDNVDF